MPLAMPRPMKRSAFSFHQFIQRIPADVIGAARGKTLAIPIGTEAVRVTLSDKAIDVRCSLRTRDPSEAKARQAAVTAYLERAWGALRAKPVVLSKMEITALAGLLYRELTAQWEEGLGPPPRGRRSSTSISGIGNQEHSRSGLAAPLTASFSAKV